MVNGELAEIHRRAKKGIDLLSEKDAKTAEAFIMKYEKNIIEKWINFFVLRRQIRCTTIKKKI
jgi:mRNA-degrading endonuclease RelE of RelBE toxin-antitoxin system